MATFDEIAIATTPGAGTALQVINTFLICGRTAGVGRRIAGSSATASRRRSTGRTGLARAMADARAAATNRVHTGAISVIAACMARAVVAEARAGPAARATFPAAGGPGGTGYVNTNEAGQEPAGQSLEKRPVGRTAGNGWRPLIEGASIHVLSLAARCPIPSLCAHAPLHCLVCRRIGT